MQEFQLPDKIIRLVKATMENSQCQVKIQADLSDPLITMSGLRQSDSLACLLFNIALGKVIRDVRIQTRVTIFYKSVQLLAYADNIGITGRSEHSVKKIITALKSAAGAMGLSVNQEKTKYMVVKSKSHIPHAPHIHIINYNFGE
jgi:sorting nexin-29